MELEELEEFSALTKDLLTSDQVRSMGQWAHHGQISCLDHSLSVAFLSFKLAKKLGLDTYAVARGGLLHDLYLYDKNDHTAHSGLQCFDHPKAAAENAKKLTDLSEKEENIIRAHMWPCGGQFPRSLEAVLVNLVDTASATMEFMKIGRPQELREKLFLKLGQSS